MPADVYIHVLDGYVNAEDVMTFMSNHLGSKYFGYDDEERQANWEKYFEIIESTPSVFVGEVSWLKAAIFGESDAFIPSAVSEVRDIIGEDFPIVDDDIIERVAEAMRIKNTTGYGQANVTTVVSFLRNFKGRQAFTVSW